MNKKRTLFNIKFCTSFVLFVTLFALILHLSSLTPAPQNDPWGISDTYFTTIILSLIGLDKILVFVILIIIFRKKLSIHSKGSKYKSLILFDLAVLDLTNLPIVIHDSVLLKQIEDFALEQILKLYTKSKKQIFIALDKGSSYTKEAQRSA